MKTLKIDKCALAVRVVMIAQEFDTYEYMDNFSDDEVAYEHVMKMFCCNASIRSLIDFMNDIEEECTDNLMSRNIPEEIEEQFVELRDEAISIRRLLYSLLLDNNLFTNNSRKMAGLPLLRKKDKRKRRYTRCEADETVTAFLAYCNGR